MIYQIIIILFLLSSSYSLINNNINPIPNLLHKPKNMIDYLTSIKDYTIITIGYKNKDLQNLLNEKEYKVYHVNLENLLQYNIILEYLNLEYKNYDDNYDNNSNDNSNDKLWIFYKGNYIGSEKDINNLSKFK